MKAQDVAVFDGVGDGVGVEPLLEQVLGGDQRLFRVVGASLRFDSGDGGVVLEDGRAGEAEELGLGEEGFDGLVVVAKLRTVAFVKDEDDAFVFQRFELFLVGALAVLGPLLVALAAFIQGQAELLDGGDDDLVGVVL